MADIFFVVRPNENQAYRNKIDRKHVDFVGCDPTTMKPLLGVELDDKSHSRSDRAERDDFVNQVFQVSGLPLIRIPAKAAAALRIVSLIFIFRIPGGLSRTRGIRFGR